MMKPKKPALLTVLAILFAIGGMWGYQQLSPNISVQFQRDLTAKKTPLNQLLERSQDWSYVQFGSCGGIERKNQSYHFQFKVMTPKAELLDMSQQIGSIDYYFKGLEGVYKQGAIANPDCDLVDLTLMDKSHYYSLKFKIDSQFLLASEVQTTTLAK